MTNEEAIYLLRNTAWLAPSLEPIDEAIDMACEALRKTKPTISKMEQVDKDINVRSKDEPQTNADQHVQHVGSVEPMQTERSE